MSRTRLNTYLHLSAAVIMSACIALIFMASLVSLLIVENNIITPIKNAIAYPGMAILIPCLLLVFISGNTQSKNRSNNLITFKKMRMKLISVYILSILLPSSFILSYMANRDYFNFYFYSVQFVEFFAGGMILLLVKNNLIDGFRLSRRFVRKETD